VIYMMNFTVRNRICYSRIGWWGMHPHRLNPRLTYVLLIVRLYSRAGEYLLTGLYNYTVIGAKRRGRSAAHQARPITSRVIIPVDRTLLQATSHDRCYRPQKEARTMISAQQCVVQC